MPLLAFLALGASECSHAVKPDISAITAAEAGDKSVLIEGCGSQPVVGYTYCRMREGTPTNGSITLIAPPTDCGEESCVSFTLFMPDGSASLGYQLPKKITRQEVAWKDLVKTASFQKSQRGFWPVVMKWRWLSAIDGKPYESYAEGEIRLRVVAASYTPLHEIHEDPNFVWKWSEGKINYRMSTAGRASVWKD